MKDSIKGKFTISEILNQAEAWTTVIDVVQAKEDELHSLFAAVDEVVFTGCGSALNISCVLASTFQQLTGIRARAVPAADLLFFTDSVLSQAGRTLLVLISRSGETTETVLACETGQSRQCPTLSITCYPDSSLAQVAEESLVLEGANEQSVTTTQSLTGMVLCGQMLAGIVGKNDTYLAQLTDLPVLGSKVVDAYQVYGREIAENDAIRKYAFVGNGPFYGLARECQLKIKEMVLLPSDSYPLMDYRHGPKSNVDASMLVTVLMSDSARRVELEFIKEMKSLGGLVQVICDEADQEIRQLADYLVEIDSNLPDFARGVLYMPPVHFLAYNKSLLQGQDPDNPANLTYWVETPRR